MDLGDDGSCHVDATCLETELRKLVDLVSAKPCVSDVCVGTHELIDKLEHEANILSSCNQVNEGACVAKGSVLRSHTSHFSPSPHLADTRRESEDVCITKGLSLIHI